MASNYTYFNGKRKVGGTAAFNHLVWTVYNGPEDYDRRIVEDALGVIKERIENDLKKSQLKVVK